MHILDSLRCLLDVLIAVEHRASELKDHYIFYQKRRLLRDLLIRFRGGLSNVGSDSHLMLGEKVITLEVK
jgi:hypothetical protein